MKVKFKVREGETGKFHRLCVKGNSMRECDRELKKRLSLMGIKTPQDKDIHFQIIKT